MSCHSVDLAAVKRALAILACGAVLSGCVSATRPGAPALREAEPRTAILYRDTVTVGFSDGALCVALRPGRARAWSGVLQGCPHGRDYRVEMPAGGDAPRRVLVRTESGATAVIAIGETAFGLRPGV
ncbi:hypothetical protein [Oceaniglobus indicus]|uniref:hypothetical protein n=1 Tax=Oceaniglobus indicus TaxID=2047749 RepID=UPI0011AB346C|nr:hypothetical protein [Oceaniglobus indicus]